MVVRWIRNNLTVCIIKQTFFLISDTYTRIHTTCIHLQPYIHIHRAGDAIFYRTQTCASELNAHVPVISECVPCQLKHVRLLHKYTLLGGHRRTNTSLNKAVSGKKPPGKKPPGKKPPRKKPPRKKPPRKKAPEEKSPPDKSPPEKSPPEKAPREKTKKIGKPINAKIVFTKFPILRR